MTWLHLGSFFLFLLIDSTNSLLPSTFSEFGGVESNAPQFSVSADNLFSAKGSVANTASAVSDACLKAATQRSVVLKCKYNMFSAFVFVLLFRFDFREMTLEEGLTLETPAWYEIFLRW